MDQWKYSRLRKELFKPGTLKLLTVSIFIPWSISVSISVFVSFCLVSSKSKHRQWLRLMFNKRCREKCIAWKQAKELPKSGTLWSHEAENVASSVSKSTSNLIGEPIGTWMIRIPPPCSCNFETFCVLQTYVPPEITQILYWQFVRLRTALRILGLRGEKDDLPFQGWGECQIFTPPSHEQNMQRTP